ncbi:hypothetical protein [Umezawaea beigongshangensis]|jgi:hypothetical protein|uniref:hypothetical protein n=1 Tax=Umezawaea beigongshangensis TaxID=2780383 RepID=UPI0018F1B7E2|nr:hypothetical protein [Umezawaea beigongshangensis]
MTWARPASSTDLTTGRFAEARALEKVHSSIQNGRAARTVAVHASDTQDCRDLLEMLGLDASEGRQSVSQ